MLFVAVLLLLLLGPIVWAVVQGIRHPSWGSPAEDDTLESAAMIQYMKDMGDLRTGGRGLI